MTDKETYLSRGYTKEGKKVVGYAFYRNNQWYIAKEYECEEDGNVKIIGGDYQEIFASLIEITSPPQKCLGIRDCEGELIFEGDRVKIGNKIYSVRYFEGECGFGLFREGVGVTFEGKTGKIEKSCCIDKVERHGVGSYTVTPSCDAIKRFNLSMMENWIY